MGRACLCILFFFSMVSPLVGCGGSQCRDTCEQVGEGRCSQGGLQVCLDADGCLLWSEPLACASGERCEDGRCVNEQCQDTCEQEGQGICSAGELQVCLEADGCLVWSQPLACQAGEHCADGRCVPDDCQDECPAWLDTRCADLASVQTCVLIDGCLRWADAQPCDSGQTCMDGRCQGCAGGAGTFANQALDVDEAPQPGTLLPPWSADGDFPGSASLLEVESTAAGGLVVTGVEGEVWVRPGAVGEWTAATGLSQDFTHNLTGLCVLPSGAGLAVGEGYLAATADGGLTWTDRSLDTAADFYAIAFHDDQLGLAVGSHGTAWLTEDGGQTWQDVSTGLDAFLGDVVWLDAQCAVAVGQDGNVLTLSR